MRILHFNWALAQGGTENLVVDLANEQCRDHQVMVLVANEAIDAALVARLHPSVRLVHLKRPEGSRNPLWTIRLLAAMNVFRPDVVHSHTHSLAMLGRLIAAPLVLTVHTTGLNLSRHANKYSAICCISKAVEEDIRQRYPNLSPCLVSNGIHTSAIPVRSSSPTNPVRAVQVSRLVHATKGQDLLIEAMAIINAGHDMPKITVDFIGSGSSLEYLSNLVAKNNLSNCCNFLGALSRETVFENLRNYDLLVQPSRNEGFGLTVAEGMAAGIPVVISDLPGPMEVINQGQHGFYFRSGDSCKLAEVLQAVISDINEGRLKSRLITARQYAIDHYDLAETSANYLKIYKEVICAH